MGTRLDTVLPTEWSVPDQMETTDEAAWLIHGPNFLDKNAVEGGYYSGFFPYGNKGFTSGLVPYYTYGNGDGGGSDAIQSQMPETFLHPGDNATLIAENDPRAVYDGRVIVSDSYGRDDFVLQNVGVKMPGLNHGQGEVRAVPSGTHYPTAWMGGGVGEDFTAYWTDNGSNWYLWGALSPCQNVPYWTTVLSPFHYKNGGW